MSLSQDKSNEDGEAQSDRDEAQGDGDPSSALDDAAPAAPVDSDLGAALDAALEEPSPDVSRAPSLEAGGAADTSTSDAGVRDGALSTGACSGTRALDLCWYLGSVGASCMEACASHGGYDPATARAVGSATQGGDVRRCDEVLTALGHPGTILSGLRNDELGLGCHLWGSDRFWLTGPDLSPFVGTLPARIACACQR